MYKENLKKNQEQIQQGLALKYALSQSSLFSYSEEWKIKKHLKPNLNNTKIWDKTRYQQKQQDF